MRDDGFVYFMLCEDTGRIKIGFSVDPERRCVGLNSGSSTRVTLLGSVAGDKDLERALHALCWESAVEHISSREWFHPTDAVLKVLAAYGIETPVGHRHVPVPETCLTWDQVHEHIDARLALTKSMWEHARVERAEAQQAVERVREGNRVRWGFYDSVGELVQALRYLSGGWENMKGYRHTYEGPSGVLVGDVEGLLEILKPKVEERRRSRWDHLRAEEEAAWRKLGVSG